MLAEDTRERILLYRLSILNKIEAPEYRQVNIETLINWQQQTATPNLQIEEYIVLDVLIGHAVRLA